MSREEPNLKALLAFEKTAATGSLSDAARQMNVSAGAIGRYIGILEAELGVTLFERSNGRLKITQPGLEYYQSVRQGLEIIRRASRNLSTWDANTIRIWCYPIIASEWLLPRIDLFQRRENVRISLITGLEIPQDVLRQCELAIIPAEELSQEFHSRFFYEEKLVPVCVPAVVDETWANRDRLQDLPILTSRTRIDSWRDWFDQHFQIKWDTRVDFDQSTLALRAAREGLGIALVADIGVSASLSRGSLALPFGNKSVLGMRLHLVWKKRSAGAAALGKLCDWLTDEMNETQRELSGIYEGQKALERS